MGMEKNPRLGTRGWGLPKGKWIALLILMLSFIMASMTLTARGATVSLPRTGQTTCYDSAGTEISCAGTGQDGEIQAGVAWPSPRFTDNGDGTITDDLTGLMWLRDANCIATHYPEFDVDRVVGDTAGDGFVTWVHADDFVNKINKGTYPLCGAGRTDWRFPNAIELESLSNAGTNNPRTWLTSQGFQHVDYDYWSSTTPTCSICSEEPDSAISVGFDDGLTMGVPKTEPFAVWPVRGTTSGPAQLWKTGQTTAYATADDGDLQGGVAWPDPRFTNNGDGTVTDNLTGLTWLRDMNCIHTHYPSFDADRFSGDGAVSWQHALDFVRGINSGTYASCGAGYTDWRLPNRKELMSIIHYGQDTGTWLVSQGFTNPDLRDIYWSSTTVMVEGLRQDAYDVDFLGIQADTKILSTIDVWVWPVRTGPPSEHISPPSTPSGPTTGVAGVSYAYSTGGSVSNLGAGHPIEYQLNWGDQTTSEWSSSGSASHSWSSPGILHITAQARCAIDHEVVSSWSDEASITISLPPGPDLTGTWTYLTQTCKTPKSGTKCKIAGELVIQNIGTQNAPSSVVKFYLSDDEVYDENDTFLKRTTIGKMKANASKTTKVTFSLSKAATGKYIIAVIDINNAVNEQYETNNNIAFGPIK